MLDIRVLTFLLYIFLQGGHCYIGEVGEDGLLHFSNKILDVARTATPEAGQPLALVCTSAQPYTSCWFTNPLGSTFTVTEGSVMDENGNPVPGITSWEGTDGQHTCGILVESYDPSQHYETWKCSLEQKNQYYQYLLGYISVSEEALSNLRLRQEVYPLRYEVSLSPNSSSTFTSDGAAAIQYTGTTSIQLKADLSTQCIVLHADEMTVWNTDTASPVTHVGIDFQRTLLQVCTKDTFEPDTLYQVDFTFEVDTLRKGYSQYGFYMKYCETGKEDLCWFTQGEATNARNIFPCFDEPAFKAPIIADVIVPEGYSALSNMPRTSLNGARQAFQESVPMSSYLFALAITNFVEVVSPDSQDVSVWCSEADMEAGRADYSAAIGARIISFYGQMFNAEYPLPKMDLVVETQKFGAMENWGLILFDPRTLLVDPEQAEKPGLSEERWLVSIVVAHELAHQWFGNLVTLSWWDQMWLNEGFATYVSYMGTDLIDPENLPLGRFLVEETNYVMLADSDTTVHWAMTDPVVSRTDIERKFGMFTYQKGASVIRMVEGVLGFQTLLSGLSNYLNDLAYAASTEDDLFYHLEEVGKLAGVWPGSYTGSKSFGEVMKTWTNQAGYPVVNASTRCDPDRTCRLVLSQEWFVSSGETNGEQRMWTIPIDMVQPGGGSPLIWIEDKSEVEVDISDLFEQISESQQPVVLNSYATGYYRINYDADNWWKIGTTLAENPESIINYNRVQIFCDITALLKTGYVTRDIYDHVTVDWQMKETDPVVLWAFDSCMSGYKDYVPKYRRI